jgi:hypothetical protein
MRYYGRRKLTCFRGTNDRRTGWALACSLPTVTYLVEVVFKSGVKCVTTIFIKIEKDVVSRA